jgi:hypothetical protein
MATSKTPEFDKALDEILATLVPGSRVCSLSWGGCGQEFILSEKDVEFLKMLRVRAPNLCPACRNKRRLSFANYSSIYKRKCDVPGHDDVMISPVAPVMPWVTYDYETYYGDSWDPFSYNTVYNAESPFFSQFLNILSEIPQPGVRRGPDATNSDFSFYGRHMKNCYYVFGGRRSTDVLFSSSIYDSKNIVDSYYVTDVDVGFENVTTRNCFKCFYSYFSSSCINSSFIYDCRNCQDCFGCVNLRNKTHCFFNEQLSKEAYEEKMKSIDLGDQNQFKMYKELFWNFVKDNPIRGTRVFQSNNVSGNDIKESNNCHEVFQIENSENVRYAYFAVMGMKECMDMNHGGHGERFYETQNVASSSNIKFSFAIKECSDSEYLMTCVNCHHCFGCIALKNASYCIFNKHYTEDEYWQKLDEIKTNMLITGEYGEFFPMSFSPCAYNSSVAQILYPMTQIEAEGQHLFWQPESEVDVGNLDVLSLDELPLNSKDTTPQILEKAIVGRSGKPFRITARELDFYKRYQLPLPIDPPYERMLNRYTILNNFRIEQDVCFLCKKDIWSSYRTSDGYKPYCEECYQREII